MIDLFNNHENQSIISSCSSRAQTKKVMIQKNHDLKGRHKAPKYCLTICCRVFSARKVGPSQETYFSTGKIHVVFCKFFINLMNTHLICHFYHTSKLIYQFFSFFDSSIQYRLSAYIVHTLYDGIRVMCK